MKNAKKLFIGALLLAIVIVPAIYIWQYVLPQTLDVHYQYKSRFGNFLSAQHAVYINDFDSAANFLSGAGDKDIGNVVQMELLVQFLDGKMPENADGLKNNKNGVFPLIYDAYLAKNQMWDDLYVRHKTDESTLSAQMRIWSAVAKNRITKTFKFIDKLNTTDSYKHFIRGQIYAEIGQSDKAATEFSKIGGNFININDYLYLTAFYNNNNMSDASAKLRNEFIENAGGMYMSDIKYAPQWSDYAGINNALSFSLIQSVSHTSVMIYSDLSLLMLQFAGQIVKNTGKNDALNYYLGQYFWTNGGNYKKYFDKIDKNSPFYPFAKMKIAEKTGKTSDLERVLHANPLFTPAITKLVAKNIQNNSKRPALRIINRALDNENLTQTGRAYLLSNRAQVYLIFGDYKNAQHDIRTASDILPNDVGIILIQSRLWSARRQDVDLAYDYAMALVQKKPSEIEYWDALGYALWVRQGASVALETMQNVAAVATTCSLLFDHMGDMYVETGDLRRARDAYSRAINLSDDGLVIKSKVLEKLDKLDDR